MVRTRMRRGQAFETMMLVISVIVAIAILGILLGFIGGIGGFGANAKTVMPDLMKKVQARGVGLEVKDKVEFSSGDRYFPAEVVGETPVNPANVKFSCNTEAGSICGTGTEQPVTVTSSQIVVNKKISGAVAVCSADGINYRVCIGTTSAKASEQCATKTGDEGCGLAG